MQPNNLRKLGINIRKIRRGHGWTQVALAQRAQIHPVYISYIENGSRNPCVSKIFQLGRALKCRPGEIFRGIF